MTYSRNKKESEKGIKLCGNKCIVCGWDKRRRNGSTLLIGAHVRPFESGQEFDRYDDIIALCPNHHAEYDEYNFYIDVKTKCLCFRDPTDNYNGKDVSESIKHIKTEYLAYEKYLYDQKNGLE